MMPYGRIRLPKTLHMSWMAYADMAHEFSREIANTLNQLTDYTHRLQAWSTLLPSMVDRDKIDATHEFIEPIAILALNLPAAIRWRFYFATTHLCHQANRARAGASWRDDLALDCNIGLKQADRYAGRWSSYATLKEQVSAIGDDDYDQATHDFRNAYNHRFPPRVIMGITAPIVRRVEPTQVSYTFGGTKPLSLDRPM